MATKKKAADAAPPEPDLNEVGVWVANRFRPGTSVELVRVDGDYVLRGERGEVVAETTAGDDGLVEFTDGVELGVRYFVRGHVDGEPVEVRVRGECRGEASAILAQPPVAPDKVKTAGER